MSVTVVTLPFMSSPNERSEPWWQTNLGAGLISGTVSGIAVVLLIAAGTQAITALRQTPSWVISTLFVVAVLGALIAIPLSRHGLRRLVRAIWSVMPVRRGRLAEAEASTSNMTIRAVQADNARADAERAKARFARSVEDLSDAVRRAQAEGVAFEAQRDDARRELQESKSEYERLLAAALEAQKRAGEKGSEDGQNAGIKLGRLLEKYGDDYTELSPAQKADRKQQAQHREAQLRGLEKTIADLQGRMSADHDERVAALREQFEIGRRQGYDEAWKEVAGERRNDSGDAVPDKPAVALRPPRWRIYHSSMDDPTDDEWTIHNPVKSSGITSLRLEVDRKRFSVYDAADWPEVEPDQEYFTFHGSVTRFGGANGYAFRLVWEVGDGWPHSEEIPPEEPSPCAG